MAGPGGQQARCRADREWQMKDAEIMTEGDHWVAKSQI